MFRNGPGCSGMFHVPGFIDGPHEFTYNDAGLLLSVLACNLNTIMIKD